MSSLQVTNVFFDESANNGFLYTGTNSLTVRLGGNNIVTFDKDYFIQPNIIFTQANSAFVRANLAFDQANAAFNAANAASITVINDTANATRFLAFTTTSSGSATTLNVSNSRLTFNPNTGTLSATIFNSLSDESLKTNVTTIQNSLDVIRQLDGVSFNWKDNGRKSYGVIAQEIEKILPDLVDNANGIKNVNYSGIIAFLIQAIKELEAKIDERKF